MQGYYNSNNTWFMHKIRWCIVADRTYAGANQSACSLELCTEHPSILSCCKSSSESLENSQDI